MAEGETIIVVSIPIEVQNLEAATAGFEALQGLLDGLEASGPVVSEALSGIGASAAGIDSVAGSFGGATDAATGFGSAVEADTAQVDALASSVSGLASADDAAAGSTSTLASATGDLEAVQSTSTGTTEALVAGLTAQESAAAQAAAANESLSGSMQPVAAAATEVQGSFDGMDASMLSATANVGLLTAGEEAYTAAAAQAATAGAALATSEDAVAAGASKEAAAETEAAAATERHGSSMVSTASHINMGVLAVGALSAAAIGMGASFEAQMSKVEGFAGVAHDQIAGLSAGVLDISRNTGEAANSVAQGLYFVESAGFHGADAMHILAEDSKLAAAGMTESKIVTDATTSALKAYGDTADSLGHIQDVLVATVVAGKMEFSDYGASIGRILPLAAAAGLSLEQVGASVATMTEKGLSASSAITSLRSILQGLEKPTQGAVKEMENLGLSADGVRASIRDNGLLQTLQDMVARTDGNYEALTHLIPNVKALTGVLADLGPAGNDYKAQLDSISNSQGAAGRAMQAYADTSEASMKRAWASIKADLIEVGGAASHELQPLIDGIGQVAQAGDKLMQASPAFKAAAEGVLLLGTGAAVLSVVAAGAGFVGDQMLGMAAKLGIGVAATEAETVALGELAVAEESASALMSPFGAAIAGIGPAVGAGAAALAEMVVSVGLVALPIAALAVIIKAGIDKFNEQTDVSKAYAQSMKLAGDAADEMGKKASNNISQVQRLTEAQDAEKASLKEQESELTAAQAALEKFQQVNGGMTSQLAVSTTPAAMAYKKELHDLTQTADELAIGIAKTKGEIDGQTTAIDKLNAASNKEFYKDLKVNRTSDIAEHTAAIKAQADAYNGLGAAVDSADVKAAVESDRIQSKIRVAVEHTKVLGDLAKATTAAGIASEDAAQHGDKYEAALQKEATALQAVGDEYAKVAEKMAGTVDPGIVTALADVKDKSEAAALALNAANDAKNKFFSAPTNDQLAQTVQLDLLNSELAVNKDRLNEVDAALKSKNLTTSQANALVKEKTTLTARDTDLEKNIIPHVQAHSAAINDAVTAERDIQKAREAGAITADQAAKAEDTLTQKYKNEPEPLNAIRALREEYQQSAQASTQANNDLATSEQKATDAIKLVPPAISAATDAHHSLVNAQKESQASAVESSAGIAAAFHPIPDAIHSIVNAVDANLMTVGVVAVGPAGATGANIGAALGNPIAPAAAPGIAAANAAAGAVGAGEAGPAGANGQGIGAALGAGIAAGIDGMVGTIAASAANAVAAAVNAAKAAGAIQSPSAVMRDEVGAMLGQGVAEGITSQTDMMQTAAVESVNAMLSAVLADQEIASASRKWKAKVGTEQAAGTRDGHVEGMAAGTPAIVDAHGKVPRVVKESTAPVWYEAGGYTVEHFFKGMNAGLTIQVKDLSHNLADALATVDLGTTEGSKLIREQITLIRDLSKIRHDDVKVAQEVSQLENGLSDKHKEMTAEEIARVQGNAETEKGIALGLAGDLQNIQQKIRDDAAAVQNAIGDDARLAAQNRLKEDMATEGEIRSAFHDTYGEWKTDETDLRNAQHQNTLDRINDLKAEMSAYKDLAKAANDSRDDQSVLSKLNGQDEIDTHKQVNEQILNDDIATRERKRQLAVDAQTTLIGLDEEYAAAAKRVQDTLGTDQEQAARDAFTVIGQQRDAWRGYAHDLGADFDHAARIVTDDLHSLGATATDTAKKATEAERDRHDTRMKAIDAEKTAGDRQFAAQQAGMTNATAAQKAAFAAQKQAFDDRITGERTAENNLHDTTNTNINDNRDKAIKAFGDTATAHTVMTGTMNANAVSAAAAWLGPAGPAAAINSTVPALNNVATVANTTATTSVNAAVRVGVAWSQVPHVMLPLAGALLQVSGTAQATGTQIAAAADTGMSTMIAFLMQTQAGSAQYQANWTAAIDFIVARYGISRQAAETSLSLQLNAAQTTAAGGVTAVVNANAQKTASNKVYHDGVIEQLGRQLQSESQTSAQYAQDWVREINLIETTFGVSFDQAQEILRNFGDTGVLQLNRVQNAQDDVTGAVQRTVEALYLEGDAATAANKAIAGIGDKAAGGASAGGGGSAPAGQMTLGDILLKGGLINGLLASALGGPQAGAYTTVTQTNPIPGLSIPGISGPAGSVSTSTSGGGSSSGATSAATLAVLNRLTAAVDRLSQIQQQPINLGLGGAMTQIQQLAPALVGMR